MKMLFLLQYGIIKAIMLLSFYMKFSFIILLFQKCILIKEIIMSYLQYIYNNQIFLCVSKNRLILPNIDLCMQLRYDYIGVKY